MKLWIKMDLEIFGLEEDGKGQRKAVEKRMKIVLASGSPRRKELLEQVGAVCEVRPSNADETIAGGRPDEIVKELALRKGKEVAAYYGEGAVILSADTVVASQGRILGKPKDEEDALEMLGELQGKEHQVYTGVAILIQDKAGERQINFAAETKVKVLPMDREEILAYIRTGEPMDKAGAYGIQGKFAPYIEGIEGDYYNVMGLPLSAIFQELKKEGISLVS